jgi:hypothetical protein
MDTLTELGSSHLTNLAHLSTAANRQPVPSGNIGNNPALFSRLTLNAAAAARNAAAMRAGTEAVAPTPVAQQVAAIWMQLSCSGNPFTLSLGDSTPLSLRVTTVLPGNPAEVKDYRLQGI